MKPPRSFSTAFLAFFSVALASSADRTRICHLAHSAWHGQTHLPHEHSSTCGRPFTPYYVPNGAISISDDHPSVIYSPSDAWKLIKDKSSIGGSSHASDIPGANVTINFTGTGIEWFGKTSRNHKASEDPSLNSRDQKLTWSLEQKGQTGVAAMQLAIVSDTEAIIIDKVEHNPLSIIGHPAWGAIYNLDKHTVRPLNMQTNSFCAGGGFLGNGTLVNVGGNPVVEDATGAVDFGDKNGLQGIRLYTPCSDGTCDIYDNSNHLRLKSPRWYATVNKLEDGSAMIIGGSTRGGWINNKTDNNPTIEYFPPKRVGKDGLVALPFLKDTLNSNLFPIAFSLPDGRVFMAANNDAMIYDWREDSERRLPPIPNGVRVTYPMTGTAVLLPLSPANKYQPEVLICGGSSLDDRTPGYQLSARDPASKQCARMVLSDVGISAGWQVEEMPEARIMPDAVLLPDGRVVIVNGGRSGIAGYGNTKDQVGSSNADGPVYTPVLYDPAAPAGQRFSSAGMPTSDIARLYHSVATLTPQGSIMIAGSNPNLDRSNAHFATEYRVEWLRPDYFTKSRPRFSKLPDRILFGATFELEIELPQDTKQVKVSLMDLGFVTHSVHMNSRLVELDCTPSPDGRSLTIHAPPSGLVYPPGPGWIYILADGVPSSGKKMMVGDGGNLYV
ncbi:glyoxal oxidase [Ceratobasidium sp. AG-Ba]|nr:glyoxal oxidase [Ceratobasidium sp. AG-Ba]